VVGAGLFGGVHLVRHHGGQKYRPVGAGRRRHQSFTAVALERLRQLGKNIRFAAVYRVFRAAAGLSGQDPFAGSAHGHYDGNEPDALYTVMAVANGIYLSSHNLFRGLPKAAVYGNFFRSILSIPIAIVLNIFIGACWECSV
jgi:hypothetical protein